MHSTETRSDQKGRNSCVTVFGNDVTVFGNDVWLHIFADRILFEMAWAVVLQLIPLFFCCGKVL